MTCPQIAGLLAPIFLVCTSGLTQKPGASDTTWEVPKNLTLDPLSKAAFTRWHALEYHLGRAGVQRLRMKIQAHSKSPLGSAQTEGTYSHDGKQARLQWKDPKLGTMLAEHGWDARTMSRWLNKAGVLTTLGDARLTASKGEGGAVLVKISGATTPGYTALRFDPQGRLAGMTLTTPAKEPGKKPQKLQVTIRHQRVGEQVLIGGWGFERRSAAGSLTGQTLLTYKELDGHQVISKVAETLRVDGKVFSTHSLVFSEHAINPPGPSKDKPAKTTKK